MKTLRQGSSGSLVRSLQHWYTNFEPILIDGKFGSKTAALTRELQARFGLSVDGVVGPKTAGRFMLEGWLPSSFEQPSVDAAYPVNPSHYGPLTQAQKVQKFGSPGRNAENPEPGGPLVRDPAFGANIVRLRLTDWFPHLEGVKQLDLHRAVERQWRALFDAIRREELGSRLVSCAGSWNPRYVRGSTTSFSSHAFATAIDFNAPQNGLGATPAKLGQRGSLVEIVPLVVQYRIYWGGWMTRVDGMHFESTATDGELGL